jgi:hypothetical protein
VLENLRLNKLFWTITTALALAAALAGIVDRNLYDGLFPKDFLPGAFPQDILTVLACVALFIVIATMREGEVRKQVVVLGVIGSFFYLYGIFTIERVYNAFYLLYAAVFGLSFWSLAYSLSQLKMGTVNRVSVPAGMRLLTAICSLLIAAVFTFLWTMALVPLLKARNRIDFLYSIYILDLCFVMPAFAVTAIMALRGKMLGAVLGPAIMILGFFVIFPLALNELAKPAAGLALSAGPLAASLLFSALMLVLAVLQLRAMRGGSPSRGA